MNLMQGTMDDCRFEYIKMKIEKRDIKNSIHVSILFHYMWSIESGAGNNGNTLYVYDLKKKLKEWLFRSCLIGCLGSLLSKCA